MAAPLIAAAANQKMFSGQLQCCSYQNHQDPIYVVNWHFSTRPDVKDAAMLFFKYSVNRYGLGLSSELLFIIVAQGATKL